MPASDEQEDRASRTRPSSRARGRGRRAGRRSRASSTLSSAQSARRRRARVRRPAIARARATRSRSPARAGRRRGRCGRRARRSRARPPPARGPPPCEPAQASAELDVLAGGQDAREARGLADDADVRAPEGGALVATERERRRRRRGPRPRRGVSRPARSARSVDLPEPDGPVTTVSVPGAKIASTALERRLAPYRRVTPAPRRRRRRSSGGRRALACLRTDRQGGARSHPVRGARPRARRSRRLAASPRARAASRRGRSRPCPPRARRSSPTRPSRTRTTRSAIDVESDRG